MYSFIVSANQLGSMRLPENGSLRRRPPRPEGQRQPGYEDTFDFFTLFYDVFRLPGDGVRFMGPPLFNLKANLEQQGSLCLDGEEQGHMAARRYGERVMHMDVSAPDAERFSLSLPSLNSFEGKISESGTAHFAGRNVLMTMIKYDPLAWVRQWVEFHVRMHGVDSVLLYNNQAPDYQSKDIIAALDGVEGLLVAGVVEWFFPYGPGAGESGKWDSAYAQVGAMEHARWRFLQEARCMVNADVDELVFCRDDGADLINLVEQSQAGYLAFGARWATAEAGAQHALPFDQRLMSKSCYLNPRHTENAGKWVAVPSRLSNDIWLGVHRIEALASDPAMEGALTLRHLPEFNAGWKGKRQIGAKMSEPDPIMQRAFTRIGWL